MNDSISFTAKILRYHQRQENMSTSSVNLVDVSKAGGGKLVETQTSLHGIQVKSQ
ncbi:hypothetical protein DEO72_LG3g1761 [Vigna unguiculata]|uniref:Uncharacterized protein n=1 Tax=Vigna unguiculata TaxID=3917 RepID=A0A4D6LF93_VIGUN|nr:hypothetical protein DEO72_LG3g1761 [Vigna unguiculata]